MARSRPPDPPPDTIFAQLEYIYIYIYIHLFIFDLFCGLPPGVDNYKVWEEWLPAGHAVRRARSIWIDRRANFGHKTVAINFGALRAKIKVEDILVPRIRAGIGSKPTISGRT